MSEQEALDACETLVIAPGRVRPRYLDQNDSNENARGLNHTKWATLLVLFLVTAAFGVPMLWRNERFTNAERWFWSSVVVVYTIAMIAGLVWWIRTTVGELPV